jgi:nanoRNase/pAp phosphatase (c-di-AMP/oligoRNAs hydrolase)
MLKVTEEAGEDSATRMNEGHELKEKIHKHIVKMRIDHHPSGIQEEDCVDIRQR